MTAHDAKSRPSPTPPGAWDCHVHVFGPTDRFPLAERRAYDPDRAWAEDAVAMLDRLGLAHAVLVQPSVYGVDNACLLDALTRLAGRARGVVVVDPAKPPSPAELDAWHRLGVRGIRLNWVAGDGRLTLAALEHGLAALLPLAAAQGWHLLLHAPADMLCNLRSWLADATVPVVLDHLAGIRTDDEAGEIDALAALDLAALPQVWIKIAAPYRRAEDAAGAARLNDFIKRLVDRQPERLIWGSDWPHTAPHRPGQPAQGFRVMDTARLLASFLGGLDDRLAAERILCRNPLTLYAS